MVDPAGARRALPRSLPDPTAGAQPGGRDMTFDLFGGRRLLLAGGGLGWFWIAAGAAALVLLLVLYREERKLVSRRTGLGLLGLRILAAVVLVTALFEPIAARSYHETLRGKVIVAVD